MTDWQGRPKSVFYGRFYFFGGAATAFSVFEQAKFIRHVPSFNNQTLRQFIIGTVSDTKFMY